MIILGVDPSLRCTGYGVVDFSAGLSKPTALDFGTIPNPAKLSQAQCLVAIEEKLLEAIARFRPEAMAIESTIYLQNVRTAITLGAARGAALLAAAKQGLVIHEYAPRRIKSAATGHGGAQKNQVAFMIRALLGLTVTPSSDAADALAVALTCGQDRKQKISN